MKKICLTLTLAILLITSLAQPRAARADGAIFPLGLETGYLVVRYHHVTVKIDDNHAVTRVEQEFYNPYPDTVAGRYLFPVPPDAILSRFQATFDGRPQAVTRQDAATTNAGLFGLVNLRRDPTLLQYADWESMAFDLSLPGRTARRMTLEYEQVLAPSGGLFHYHYVLGTERYSSQPLEKVSLKVDLSASRGLASVYSASHPVSIEQNTAGRAQVTWSAENVLPSEDFDLYFAPAGEGFGAGLLTGRRAEQDHFLFMFSPETGLAQQDALPKDIVFVIDRSGSMSGEKIEQARNALRYFVDRLAPQDRFSIVTFSSDLVTFSAELVSPADQRRPAQDFVRQMVDGGGTNLEGGLQEGLRILAASEPRPGAARLVVFLTDGLPTEGLTDENEITRRIAAANERTGARLHVFGVGYDVNTHLLDRLSAENGGSVTYVQPGENLELVLTGFYDRIANPVLTGVEVEFSGMRVEKVYPEVAADLFAGSSLLLSGRYTAKADQVTVRVSGIAAGQRREFVYQFSLAESGGHDFVPRLWATRRVGVLLDELRVAGERPGLVDEIRELGLGYGLITPYTSFVIAAQASGAASMSNMALYGNQQALNQSSGEVTIQARVQNQAYQQADQAGLAVGANVQNYRQYSTVQLGPDPARGLNLDLNLLQGQKEITDPISVDWLSKNVGIDRRVAFASPEYFELAADPEARAFLQSGVNVAFNYQGQVVLVEGEGGDAPAAPEAPSQAANNTRQAAPAPNFLARVQAALRSLLYRIFR